MRNIFVTDKTKGLIFNLAVYLGAFLIALIPFFQIQSLLLSELAFTVTATVIIYIISFLICVLNPSNYLYTAVCELYTEKSIQKAATDFSIAAIS